MTFLGISQAKDTSEEMASSESLATSDVWREVEFESDADHREMTRTYGCDDYLSRWLPNIKRESDDVPPVRREKNEKRTVTEKEQPNRLFKSPCHHHEGRKSTLKDNKHETTKKTYFEAIKCSPIKLRQSLTMFKRPKLDDASSKPDHNPNTESFTGALEHTTELTNSVNSTESLPENPSMGETKSPRRSLGIVEMRSDEFGQLGSLCFRNENQFGETLYTPCNMVGGKLRRIQRETVLLNGQKKQKELLVRCESIMIYPKVLINQKQNTAKYKCARKPDKPKEAWLDSTSNLQLLTETSQASENHTRLPQLKDLATKQDSKQSSSAEVQPKEHSDLALPRSIIQHSATTKIIIPFGEIESRRSAEKTFKISPSLQRRELVAKREGSSPKGERDDTVTTKTCLQKEEGVTGRSKERQGGIPTKSRCLNECSRLNEMTQVELSRKLPVATQYLTVTTPSTPLRRFRIPTGDENTELFLGRENYNPAKRLYRFPYNQRGIMEYPKGFDRTPGDNGGHKEGLSLKIGGKGLLKASLMHGEEQISENAVGEEGRKRVEFLVKKSRYFAH